MFITHNCCNIVDVSYCVNEVVTYQKLFPTSHKYYTTQGMYGINLRDDRKLDYANLMLAPYTFCIRHIVSVDR